MLIQSQRIDSGRLFGSKSKRRLAKIMLVLIKLLSAGRTLGDMY